MFRRAGGPVLVALSGGVDSAVLLALAAEVLGRDAVLAVTGRSPALAAAEAAAAARVAEHVGCAHRFVDTAELDDPSYRANRGDRCRHCRTELFGRLRAIARREGFRTIAYGAIADDLADDRPGMRAAEEARVLAPLLDAGWTKDEVRRAARRYGLPVHDKPANPCLASRVPVGIEVTRERLARIEAAEREVHALGFRVFRVRDDGGLARVELDAGGLDRIREPALRARVVAAVLRAGFARVAVDPRGYRTGGAGRASAAPPEMPLVSIGPASPRTGE